LEAVRGARGAVLIAGAAPANPKPEQLVTPGALTGVRLLGDTVRRPSVMAELLALDRLDGYVLGA
jgi:hypothetical protein